MNEECEFLGDVFQGIVAKSLADMALQKGRDDHENPEQKPGHDEEHGMNTDGGETGGKFKDKPDPENKDPGAEGRGTDAGVSWEAKTDSPGHYDKREKINMSKITSKEHYEEEIEEEEELPLEEPVAEEIPPVEGELPPVEEIPAEEPVVEEPMPIEAPMEEAPMEEEIPEVVPEMIEGDEEPVMEEEIPPVEEMPPEAVPEMGGDMGAPQISIEDLTRQVQELAAALAKLAPATEEAAADAAEGAAEVAEELGSEAPAGEGVEEMPMMAMSDDTVAKDVGDGEEGDSTGSVDDPPSDQADIKITDAPEMGSDGGGDEPSDQKDPDIDDAGQGTGSLAVEPQEDHENKVKELNQLPRKSETEVEEIPFLWETKAEVEVSKSDDEEEKDKEEVEVETEAKADGWTVEKSEAVEERAGATITARNSPVPVDNLKQIQDLIQKAVDGELRSQDVMKELGLESGQPDDVKVRGVRVNHPYAPKLRKLIR
jgi:hypothetical protein